MQYLVSSNDQKILFMLGLKKKLCIVHLSIQYDIIL